MSYYGYGRRGLDATWYLIIINSIVFFFTYIMEILNPFFYNYQVLPLLALVPDLVIIHPWTIFTHMFVHAGIWHVLSNMLTLYFFGEFLSNIVGQRKFLWVYFLGGLAGALFYIIFAFTLLPGMRNAAAVGASGAVFAVGGALVALRPNTRVFMFPLPIPIPLWVAILVGFLFIQPGIAWQAHLGGLVAGLFMGYLFRKQERRYY